MAFAAVQELTLLGDKQVVDADTLARWPNKLDSTADVHANEKSMLDSLQDLEAF